ncbi:2-oxo-tetronate isomerase [Advenella sp. RU8]|uniref:2-oxo-tetronate isomerase n=1 Tax=Advenella sp. RU8 TaxID=3399575 RepID=UPI003AABED7C
MLKFAANLSMMYTEVPFLERFALAANDQFKGVEFLFPYPFSAAEIRRQLSLNGLELVLFNAVPGDWDAGERGLACLPGRQAECLAGVEKALEYAVILGNRRVHFMAGIVPDDLSPAEAHENYCQSLSRAAALAAQAGVDLLIEPINPFDMPGYFLTTQQQAHRIVELLDLPNIKVQMDLYHCQIVEGDLSRKLAAYVPTGRVGHLQIAGVPHRHEPDTGEINVAYLFDLLRQLGYQHWIGCEYRPAGRTSEGLAWLERERLKDKRINHAAMP